MALNSDVLKEDVFGREDAYPLALHLLSVPAEHNL
jgi:hypothetical protein